MTKTFAYIVVAAERALAGFDNARAAQEFAAAQLQEPGGWHSVPLWRSWWIKDKGTETTVWVYTVPYHQEAE